jgi:UDP-N-acetylglucosamine 2-epimerase (non-hydrolysing)
MIKLAQVAHELGDQARVFHTGQHYDAAMSGSVWTGLGMPDPELVLTVGGRSRAQQIGGATTALDAAFAADPPSAVIVQGDTNATLAGALVANAQGIPLVHVEAGLRSHDRQMPEEHNRVMVDHLADLLCAPTMTNVAHLRSEGIPAVRIRRTGNTVVEAVEGQLPSAAARQETLEALGLRRDAFVLATIHRPENTDDTGNLHTILAELGRLDADVVLPLHPRTRARVQAAGFESLLEPLQVISPLPPAKFLGLAASSGAIVSDSGGLQEECSVIKRPLLVVRNSTERPEVIGSFAQRVLPGPEISARVNAWLADLGNVHDALSVLPSPYGDGTASAQIAAFALELAGLDAEPRRAA